MEYEKLLQFSITGIKQETPLAKTYELKLLNEEILNYKPGQFLTFILKTKNQELRRSYSIVSLPGEPLKITVKKVENGLISRYILQNWKTGEIIEALPPAGWFTTEPLPNAKRDIFCFAAGSGIIPILPQIRTLLIEEPQSIIHLIYSNHNEGDALFLEEIDVLAKNFAALNVMNFFSDPLSRLDERGRLSNLNVEPLINRLLKHEKEDAIFLICGPFSYMRMLQFTIGIMKFRKENVKRENYLPEVMRSGKVSHPDFPARTVTIGFRDRVYRVRVPSGKNILEAALENELHLPYSCKGGICGNCAAICRAGKVFMSINEVLTDADLEKGWVLTCTGYPETEGIIINFNIEP